LVGWRENVTRCVRVVEVADAVEIVEQRSVAGERCSGDRGHHRGADRIAGGFAAEVRTPRHVHGLGATAGGRRERRDVSCADKDRLPLDRRARRRALRAVRASVATDYGGVRDDGQRTERDKAGGEQD